jgi:hypothetical protein
MSQGTRIFNITRGFHLKLNQAEKAVENCAAIWVNSSTIRDCTLAESIAMRNQQAQTREPLCCAEMPGLIFRPPAGASNRYDLVRAANLYASR